jgi:hypothetical protein
MTPNREIQRLCELCLKPLGPVRWWDRLTGGAPPIHSSRGEEGRRCRELFGERFGMEIPYDS